MPPCTPASVAFGSVNLSWERSASTLHHSRAWMSQLSSAQLHHVANSSPPVPSTEWDAYFRSVYGDNVDMWPTDAHRLRWFWWWAPGSSNLTRIEAPVWRRTLPGEIWVPGLRMERHLSVAGFFVTPLEVALHRSSEPAAHVEREQTVEVMRISHPSSEGSRVAFGGEAAGVGQIWYWHAPGSGIFLYLGHSLVVSNRSVLLSQLTRRLSLTRLPFTVKHMHVSRDRAMRLCDGCSPTDEQWVEYDVIWPTNSDGNRSAERLCPLVRRAGFDTVQLRAAFGAQRFEIIDCRPPSTQPWETVMASMSGTTACPPRRHYGIAGQPCSCVNSRSFLNCGECARPATVTRVAQHSRAAFQVRAPGRGGETPPAHNAHP